MPADLITPRRPATCADVAAHYDELDGPYRKLWGTHLHHGLWERGDESVEEAVGALVHRVARTLRLEPGGALVDVGCGYGGTAWLLAEEYGQRVTGLSVAPSQVAVARARAARDGCEAPRFLLRDWLDNGLDARSFDRAVSLECLGHVPDKARFFAELERVLRPGGEALVTAWLAADAPTPFARRHLLEPICREGRLPSMGTASAYLDLARGAGLELRAFEDLSRQVLRTWSIGMARTLRGVVADAELRRFLLRGHSSNRVFALTLPRLWAAYRTGAMRYGWFWLAKRG